MNPASNFLQAPDKRYYSSDSGESSVDADSSIKTSSISMEGNTHQDWPTSTIKKIKTSGKKAFGLA